MDERHINHYSSEENLVKAKASPLILLSIRDKEKLVLSSI